MLPTHLAILHGLLLAALVRGHQLVSTPHALQTANLIACILLPLQLAIERNELSENASAPIMLTKRSHFPS